jgi:NAD(P)H-flavin reductase
MATAQKSKSSQGRSYPAAMIPRPFVIRRVTRELYDTFSFELDSPPGEKGFSFRPGQFNMLYVYGVGEVPISISGDPGDSKILIHTTRAVGAVTRAMCKLRIGDAVGVRGPFGSCWPVDDAVDHDVVLVTGGIGLAPVRPAIHHLLAQREKYGRIILLYGARTPEDILYRKDLERWRSRFDMDILITVDQATGKWKGNVGVVTTLIGRSTFDPIHTMAIVCGPEIMMRFSILELQKRGLTGENMYVSMERNMKCGIGLCGHCQVGASFVCKNGPVYCFSQVKDVFIRREM